MESNFDIADRYAALKAAGKLSEQQVKEMDILFAQDTEAYSYFHQQTALYQSEEVEEAMQGADQPTALVKLWARIEDHDDKRRLRVIRNRRILSAAATIALLMLVAGIFIVPRKNDSIPPPSTSTAGVTLLLSNGKVIDLSATKGNVQVAEGTLSNNNKSLTYTTSGKEISGISTMKVPIGKDYKIQLSDGSVVWLNSATTLQFPFTFGDSREITINGEAFLEIAGDAKKPFIVHLPTSSVQVLGTSFNVNTYDAGIDKVALVSGAVQLKNQAAGVKTLKPGNEGISHNGELQVGSFDADLTLSWRMGRFRFEEMTLAEICQVMPRWFGMEVVMDNNHIAGTRFSGVLDRTKPLEPQLALFKDDQVSYYWRDGVLHFK